ncbi:MAG: spermidine synthase [Candidatus Geothermarchaeales archaeon]
MSESEISSATRYVENSFPFYHRSLAVKKVLWSGRSDVQRIDLLDLYVLGKTLFLDGDLQLSVSDEYIYHEVMAHTAMLSVENPIRVLVIGGGDGGLLREVLKYDCVRETVLVELDAKVLDVCKTYLPEVSAGAFDDDRTHVVVGDGMDYLKLESGSFDVVMMDLTDPALGGPEVNLYGEEGISAVRRRLSDGGALIVQSSCHVYHRKLFDELLATLLHVFGCGVPLSVWIPSYGFPWSFILTKKDKLLPTQRTLKERLRIHNPRTRYYAPQLQRALAEEMSAYVRSVS